MAYDNTVCCIFRDEKILLKFATRGIAKGKWVQPGGGVEEGESPEEGAVREVVEETGLKVALRDLRDHGTINFHLDGKKEIGIVGYLYSTTKFSGKARGTDEGRLRWFPVERLPWQKMFPGDVYWVPQILKRDGVKLKGDIWYGKDFCVLSKHTVESRKKTKHQPLTCTLHLSSQDSMPVPRQGQG